MRFTPGTIRIRWPGLPLVLEEIVAKLLADDWCRCVAEDEQRSYYIVGLAAHEAHVFGDEAYPISEYPRKCPSSLVAEAFVRSQIPSRHTDYLPRVRKDLESAGVPPAAVEGTIDRMIAGEVGDLFEGWRWSESTTPEQRWELFVRFIEAFLVSVSSRRGEVVPLDGEEPLQVDVTREKLCLQEVSRRYQKIVQRWEQLEPLAFQDPQLEEASRAYLYGLYRATVVLSGSALETLLKRLTETERFETYRELVDKAQSRGVLGRDAANWTKEVFDARTRVVHQGWSPEPDRAKEVLVLARKVLPDFREGD